MIRALCILGKKSCVEKSNIAKYNFKVEINFYNMEGNMLA